MLLAWTNSKLLDPEKLQAAAPILTNPHLSRNPIIRHLALESTFSRSPIMAGRKVIPVLATLGLVGSGYYLYTAGGDPKVAKKEIEREKAMRYCHLHNI